MEFPQRFRTRRLLLTRVVGSDAADFLRMRNEPRVQAVLDATPAERTAALFDTLVQHWAQHGYGWWIARDPGSGRYLGCGGLRSLRIENAPQTEIAFGFLPECWGRGYATELARAAVAQGFVRLAVPDIVGLALPGNGASCRVLEKTGFISEREHLHAGRLHLLYRLGVEAWRVAPFARLAPAARRAPALQAV